MATRVCFVLVAVAALLAPLCVDAEDALPFVCVRSGSDPVEVETPQELKSQCKNLSVNDVYPDKLPLVDLNDAIVVWFQRENDFDAPPAKTELKLTVNGQNYVAPVPAGAEPGQVWFSLRGFPADKLKYGDVIQVTFGPPGAQIQRYAKWQTRSQLVVCVSDPAVADTPTPPIEEPTVGATNRSASARGPNCTMLPGSDVSLSQLPRASRREAITAFVVRDGQRLPKTDAAYAKLSLSVAGPGKNPVEQGYNVDSGGKQVLLRDLDVPHNTRLDVAVTYGDRSFPYAARVDRRLMLYGYKGLWVPLGLFGTTFNESDTGATLTALPVGVAWGGRANVADSFYVGGSVLGSYLIHKKVAKGADETGSGDYSLESIAVGGLFDVNNWFYVGGVYGKTFLSGVKDPGLMFVLGIAPDGLSVLKRKQ